MPGTLVHRDATAGQRARRWAGLPWPRRARAGGAALLAAGLLTSVALLATAGAPLALARPVEPMLLADEYPAPNPAAQDGTSENAPVVDDPALDEDGGATAPEVGEACNRTDQPPPLPQRGTPGADEFWRAFRAPLPPAPVWNPPGPKRVGLQAGHWLVEETPAELRGLGHGSSGGGKLEWEVNLDIAGRAADLLRAAGVEADVLPATVPPAYRAHAFVSIHADGDATGVLRGYKVARAVFSATPEADDRLVAALYDAYGEATGLPRDDEHVSRRMTGYYAFNSRRYCHAIAPGVPSAIIELGFLTSYADRALLIGDPDAAARGVAAGLLRFLFPGE